MLANDIVSKAQPSARAPLAHAPLQTALHLYSEVFKQQRIHRALQADMQLADLAFSNRDQPHTGK
jgi:hypothetical protein